MIHAIAIICGEYLFVLPILVGGIYFLHQPRETKKKMIMLSVVALPLTVLGMIIVNHIYQDPRPSAILDFKPFFSHFLGNNGFPSTHATLTALIASVMFVFNRKIGLFLFVISVLVASARVYLGLHHFVDIFGGIMLAIIVTAISEAILNKYIFSNTQK